MLYGDETKEASKTVEFFIFPWKIALLVLLALVVIILIIIFLIRHRRGKKLKEQKKYQEKYKKDISEAAKNIAGEKLGQNKKI
jgi:uncharacterized protein YpmS